MHSGRNGGQSAAAVLVLAGLVLVVFSDVLFSRGEWAASGPAGDVLNFYNSCRMYGFGEIRNGNLPLWNPHVFSGVSFIGNFQSALFYPPNLIYLFLPLAKALNLDLAFHVFLMGALTFAWGRGRGLTRLATFFAGMTAMFSGAFFMHVFGGHLTMIAVFAWAPMVFLAIDKTIEQPRLSWTLGGVFAITMMLLAGSPHPVFIVGVAVALYVLLHVRRIVTSPKRLAALAVMAVAPLLLSAIQLWPSLEVTGGSMRGAGASYDFATTMSFPPENLLLLIMPGFFGDDITRPYRGRWHVWETGFYLGIGGLMLAALALLRGDRRSWWPLAVVTLVLTLIALGRYTPFFALLLKTLPGIGSFRAPARYLVVASLLLAILAGHGLDAIREKKGGLRVRAISRMIAALVLVLGLMLLLGAGWVHRTTRNDSAADAEIPLGELVRAGVLCSAVGAMLLAAERRPKLVYAIAALGVVEMTLFAWAHRGAVDLAPRSNAQLAAQLGKLGDEVRVLDNPAQFNRVHCAGGYEIWGNEAVIPAQYVQFLLRTIQFKHQVDTQGPDPVADAELSPLLSMMRLKYVVTSDGTLQDAPGGFVPLPRFLLVSNYREIGGLSETFDAMGAGGFDPAQEVILERAPDPAPAQGSSSGAVDVLSVSTDGAVIEVDTPTPAILLNTDSYAPGWRARPLKPGPQSAYSVLRANGVIRAVPLAAGKHTILLEYAPASYLIGRWVSCISVALFLGVALLALTRTAHRNRQT